jgi:hypothetical protein
MAVATRTKEKRLLKTKSSFKSIERAVAQGGRSFDDPLE